MRRPALVFALLLQACGGDPSTQTPPSGTTAQPAQSSSGQTPQSGSPAAPSGSAGAGTVAKTGTAGTGPTSTAMAGSHSSGGSGAPAAGSGVVAAAGSGAPAAGSGGLAAGSSASAAAGASGSAMGAAGAAGSAAQGACDRACLLDVMDRYLKAVLAHDPTMVPISASLKMTDNGTKAKPGDGLWKTASKLHMDKMLTYADPMQQNVGVQCLMDEGSAPAMYEVRLKYVGGEITEIESMTVRQADAANGFFSPDNLKPEPVFLQMPDPAKRMTRAELESITQLYLDYLEGKKSGNEVPFDPMCKRYENGLVTADGLGSFQAQSWSFEVTRRILIIDEESQVTWGMFPFFQSDNPLVVGEAFKILEGKIKMIQAVMAYMPNTEWK